MSSYASSRASPSPLLLYVDDSGSVQSGLVIYGWIECRTHEWTQALRSLLQHRTTLYRRFGVPANSEGRHVVEDPQFHDSRRSQFIQMADLVAYSAFVHLHRHEGNQFCWQWYEDILGTAAAAEMIDLNAAAASAESSKTR